MKNILVTGSKGQLGWEIEGLSYTHSYKGFKFIFTDIDTLDITNREDIQKSFSETQIDYIINCAAYTMVDRAEEEQEKSFMVNATAVSHLLEFAAQQKSVIIHISTDYVFDGYYYLPYLENAETNPLSQYGKSKFEAEKILTAYSKSIIIRTSWLYSERGNNFLKTILRLSDERNELRVVNDQIGSPTYARDLAKVILDIILYCEREETVPAGIYHYTNEGVCSWYDFARAIIRHSGKNTRIIPIDTDELQRPAHRPPYSVLNKTKIKSEFGIFIPHWEDSLISCLSHIEN
jgi:dTDP-4-dehydrorhamnose reductase